MSKSIDYDLIFTHLPDLLFIMSVDSSQNFRYTKMNPAAMRSSGLNADAYGATFQDVVASEEAGVLSARYSRALQLQCPVSFVLNHKQSQTRERRLRPSRR